MASISSSSIQKSFKYDVFLSFRGEDTRKNFVDHLYYALQQKGIITYKDDEKIEKGERISDQLIRSIKDSRFYIIVFSKNYASSSWCLDELVKIMECHKTMGQTAYPVFYDVEPTEVRNQSGAVGEAFGKHVRGSWSFVLPLYSIFSIVASCCGGCSSLYGFTRLVKMEKEEDVARWRNALKEAAGLAGLELNTSFNGHEATFIQKVVKDISLKLHSISLSVDEKLVGMETRVKNVVSYLESGFNDVQMIGIKGMGGGGKTTLARAVFDHISIRFEGKSFVENVREVSESSGLNELQKQVLKDVVNDQSIDVTSVFDGKKMMRKMMGSRKVLVVLDDVDHLSQLEALAGELTWFKPGSRIIITTRDEQVLKAHRVNFIHDVSLLSQSEAIYLLSKYAFGGEIPIQGYEELSRKVVHYAAGLPLTLKVLGSFLYGRFEDEWEDTIERLKTIPEDQTLKRLELSYNGLENDQKEIFLDVACILKGEKKGNAIRILESCGFNAKIGLRVLEQKSLITISSNGTLHLHDHIEEMGKNIVRRLHHDEPSRHSRLWIKEEIEDILVNETGTEATRSINLKYADLHPTIIMKGLRNMKKLKFLSVYNGSHPRKIDEVSHYLPDALRSIHWPRYPFCCLPKTFRANKLADLKMTWSCISQLWEGGEKKVLNKLRFLDLSNSKLRTFDLGMTPNLETLNFESCSDLVELHMPIECPKLKIVSLFESKLSNLNLGLTPNLEELNLNSCSDFVELHMPVECPKLKFLYLGNSKVWNLNLGHAPNLNALDLRCSDFVELHMRIKLPKLRSLDLSGSNVRNLNLGLTPNIESLNLTRCYDFVELHIPVELPKLGSLNASGSKLYNLDLGLIPNIESLDLTRCYYFVELHMPIELPKLTSLDLSGSKLYNLNLGLTPNIERLNLSRCHEFVELHMPLDCPKLTSINASVSKLNNLSLGLTPNIESLDFARCYDFVKLHMPIELPKLTSINLSGSKLNNLNLGMTPNIERLNLSQCDDFVELHMPVNCPNLTSINLGGSKVTCLNLWLCPNLRNLDLRGCVDFVELYTPVECPNLEFLNLSGSKVSNFNLGMAPHLETLDLGGCYNFVKLRVPVECPKLKFLNLTGSKVRSLNLGLTANLSRLDLKECYCLQEIHAPVGCLKKLVFLNLSGCSRFEYFFVDKLLKLHGIEYLPKLELKAESLDICPLHPNNNLPKFQFKCSYDEPLSTSSGTLEKLISFGLCACTNLESFSASICGLQHLRALTLEGNIPEALKDLYKLESLEELTLSMKEIKHLPDSICMLKHLKYLNLKSCWLLEQLPNDLGRLECLEKLILTECIQLQDIPDNICKMNCLKFLHLHNCSQVKKLPDELGRSECLKELNIEGASITHLPQSIYQLKGLCVIGSRWRLESYGFTSLKTISRYTACCYIGES